MAPTCLVLGAAGFMGSHLCKALHERGYSVRAFDRPVPLEIAALRERSPYAWRYGDFGNKEDIASVVPGCDFIVHLISTTLPKNSNENPSYDVESNLLSTLNLLDVARASGVKRIIFASSGGTVYGRPLYTPIPETHPTNPICSYGITKLAIEKYLFLYHQLHGLNYVVLRLANPYGELQRPDASQGAIAVFLHRSMNRQPIEIWGDGTVTRDYLYIGDVVDAFLRAIEHERTEQVVNIGSGRGQSINELLDVIEQIVGYAIDRKYLPGRPFDVPVNVLDSRLARQELGWEPRVGLKEGLRRTLDWLARPPAANL